MSVFWLYTIANELVAILQTIGLVLNIPYLILGATILAWGNSLGGKG